MTCRECQDLSLEVARRRAAPAVADRVRAHVSGCVRCAGYLADQTSLTDGLRALAGSTETGGSAHLEQDLLSWFVELHGARPSGSDRRTTGWLPGSMSPVTAHAAWMRLAAAVLLAAGVWAAWTVTAERGGRGASPVPAPSVPAPVAAQVSIVPAEPPDDPPHRPARKAGKRLAAPPRTVQPSGFVPLPVAAGLPDFESGEIVRLELPAESLPSFGVEMPTRAGAPAVQADLLIGQDGQPRAIRLVTASSNDTRPRR